MRNSVIATSIKLPKGADILIDQIIKKQHISKTEFMRNAILKSIEDALDIELVETTLAKDKKRYSLDEVKRELDLAD
jgi:predicted DNA-binding protein